ncbi:uncharacterized protein M421DRAFT_358332 [Didymella exigua CBS 183.55]|uniref:Uncharacterized protein n=1 Tax=Didymella exigua CBS 183.55 TaxID=1150837 RepID=A0A6A5RQZ3_9PLEO|nr:uncharacterized protein M421DRAFT_358332 [Didymella exigua CBS 183.55]KAF1930765.1 hypothetical protein M421DRAFT_358332 [Didymella exigua CBS 183.55]
MWQQRMGKAEFESCRSGTCDASDVARTLNQKSMTTYHYPDDNLHSAAVRTSNYIRPLVCLHELYLINSFASLPAVALFAES